MAANDRKNQNLFLSVSGYKSIATEQTVEIRPLTILVGANSSGKSSIMQPLLLLKQTLEAQYDPGVMLINGPNVQLTSSDQIFTKTKKIKDINKFTVKLRTDKDRSIKLSYIYLKDKGLDIESMQMKSEEKNITRTIKYGMSNNEIKENLPDEYREFKFPESEYEYVISKDRCFLGFYLKSKRSDFMKNRALISFMGPDIYVSMISTLVERLIHLPGLRGNPERTYKMTTALEKFPGTFENYVAGVINQWQQTKDDRLDLLGNLLERLGLTWKVEATQLNDTQAEIRVGRLPHCERGGAFDLVSIADVGFGTSQTLPVLVALLVAQKDQIVYLEQPEIHLHPLAQTKFSEILSIAIRRGVRVVVETHSALILRGLQTLVAKGELKPDYLKIHWFKRDQNGLTEIIASDFDKTGAFENCPDDFEEVSLKAEKDYLDAVESGSLF